ncbi:MAG: NAD-dependent epimerase/dehydratase family protein [Candidatus Neomarinimicrobiota bacterium]
MRILVTGGAGFIGSHVAEKFLELGHQVVILDDLSTGRRENIPAGADFIEGDIRDNNLVPGIFEQYKFDVVNHHAAQMDIRHSVDDPAFDAQVNILGTINLLESSIRTGVIKFMFASTGGAIYGEQESFPAAEDHPTNPISPYGISKLACEKYLFYYQVQFGLQTAIMRYANVYGPRQNPFGEAGVVAIFSHRLTRGEQVTINGDGLQTRDYVYVDGAVEANVLALDYTDSITFNVGTGIETDVVTLYEHLAAAAGTDLKPRYGPAKPGEQRRSVLSPSLAKAALGWEPKVSLNEGLQKTYLSFAQHTDPKSR